MIEPHPLSRRRPGARCGRPGAGRALFIKLGTSSTASRPAAAPMRTAISSPTRQASVSSFLGLPQLVAARLKAGLRPRRVRRGVSTPTIRCAALLELGSSRVENAKPGCAPLSKTIEVQRRRWLSARHAMSPRAGLGRLVLAPRRHIKTRIDGARAPTARTRYD